MEETRRTPLLSLLQLLRTSLEILLELREYKHSSDTHQQPDRENVEDFSLVLVQILLCTRFSGGEGERDRERESSVRDGEDAAVVRHSREESRDSG